jgi:hypothetical protein
MMKLIMSRILAGFAAVGLVVAASAGPSSEAAADSWGCSFDKCLQVCTKVGGKMCSNYCNQQLKDKQLAKKCP